MNEGTRATEQRLMDAIRTAGLRLTLPRRAICQILADGDGDFLTANDIIERVASRTGRVDGSTVYRTLDELVRLGLLHHVYIGNQPGSWHITKGHDHQHLVCAACGRITAIPHSALAAAYEMIHTKYNFRAAPRQFSIPGYCDDCEPPPANGLPEQ